MIDIAAVFNFQKSIRGIYSSPFSHRVDFEHELKEQNLSGGDIFYVEKKDSTSFYCADKLHVFIFGSIFIKNEYKGITENKNLNLNACNFHQLFKNFNLEISKYIKGNFVVIIYNSDKNELIVISSRLNTLPMFYSYKEGNFIFSSSIKAILKLLPNTVALDNKGILEHLLFFYPLDDRTYFNEIFQLPPASIFKVNNAGIKIEKYWHIDKLFSIDKHFSENEALKRCLILMKNNLRLYTQDAPKFLLSLTGGFDSRLNLALLDRAAEDYLCYSYGMQGSKQIEIPLMISKKFGLSYKPVYLDEEFEKEYETYALKALELSDGSAPILRANFPYVFAKLNHFSKINITGLFGSEIIKAFYRANEQINEETIGLFTAKSFDSAFSNILLKQKRTGYIKPHIIDKYSEAIREDFKKRYIKRVESFDKISRFYIFLFEEAIRKYFMQEIRIERYYVNTRAPYFDEDFLELIFKTPFAGLYKGLCKRNIFSRRNSQLFYAKIIQMAKPALGDIITDRGYRPKDLLLPFVVRAFKIGPPYLKDRIKRSIKGNDTFNSGLWSKNMVKKYIYKIGNSDDIFTDKLIKDFENGLNLKGNPRFFSIFSLRLWLYLLNNKII